MGAPDETLGHSTTAGAVNVLYGGSAGLSAAGNQFWDQDSPGVRGRARAFDHFASALAAGDFNGDGRDDLAVGIDGKDRYAGAAIVLYGGPGGLSATGNQLLSQDKAGVIGAPEHYDEFGHSLAAGDLNGDGRDDLAVGVFGESVGATGGAGAVNVLYGSSDGLTATGNQFWTQDSPGVIGAVEPGDGFGWAVAVGDVNGDGSDDLAVGAPFDDVGNVSSAGRVNVLNGGPGGLSATGNQRWDQDSPGVLDSAESNDDFGWALAAGDLNGDGSDDLAVSAGFEDVGSVGSAGAVNVLYGGAGGLSATGNQFWTQDSPNVLDTSEVDDDFGRTLAVGDLNGDGSDDLAVGVPWEDTIGNDSGAANIVYGGVGGLSATGNQFWDQDSPGVLDSSHADEQFGSALAPGDFNADGNDDLAIAVPMEDVAGEFRAGVANVLYGAGGGLSAAGDQLWSQGSPGILDRPEVIDGFGGSLASGDGL